MAPPCAWGGFSGGDFLLRAVTVPLALVVVDDLALGAVVEALAATGCGLMDEGRAGVGAVTCCII